MSSRRQELRKKHNRILFWSLAVAGLAHVALFLLWPTMEVEPPDRVLETSRIMSLPTDCGELIQPVTLTQATG